MTFEGFSLRVRCSLGRAGVSFRPGTSPTLDVQVAPCSLRWDVPTEAAGGQHGSRGPRESARGRAGATGGPVEAPGSGGQRTGSGAVSCATRWAGSLREAVLLGRRLHRKPKSAGG